MSHTETIQPKASQPETEQQQALFDNTARSVGGASVEIQKRHVRNCLQADPAYGKGVATALGLPLEEID